MKEGRSSRRWLGDMKRDVVLLVQPKVGAAHQEHGQLGGAADLCGEASVNARIQFVCCAFLTAGAVKVMLAMV